MVMEEEKELDRSAKSVISSESHSCFRFSAKALIANGQKLQGDSVEERVDLTPRGVRDIRMDTQDCIPLQTTSTDSYGYENFNLYKFNEKYITASDRLENPNLIVGEHENCYLFGNNCQSSVIQRKVSNQFAVHSFSTETSGHPAFVDILSDSESTDSQFYNNIEEDVNLGVHGRTRNEDSSPVELGRHMSLCLEEEGGRQFFATSSELSGEHQSYNSACEESPNRSNSDLNIVGYMQQLLLSPSEEIFDRMQLNQTQQKWTNLKNGPKSGPGLQTHVPTRSQSTESFFSVPECNSSFTAAPCTSQIAFHATMHRKCQKPNVVLRKRSQSLDLLTHQKICQSFWMEDVENQGDTINIQESVQKNEFTDSKKEGYDSDFKHLLKDSSSWHQKDIQYHIYTLDHVEIDKNAEVSKNRPLLLEDNPRAINLKDAMDLSIVPLPTESMVYETEDARKAIEIHPQKTKKTMLPGQSVSTGDSIKQNSTISYILHSDGSLLNSLDKEKFPISRAFFEISRQKSEVFVVPFSKVQTTGNTKGAEQRGNTELQMEGKEIGKIQNLVPKDEDIAQTVLDINNNFVISRGSSEQSLNEEPDLSFRFQHSKDISAKEESLRGSRSSWCSDDGRYSSHNKGRRRKSVTFNNSYPVFLNIRSKNVSSENLEMTNDKDVYTVDVASSTDILNPSETDIATKIRLIDGAEDALNKLLKDLQFLWMNVSDTGSLTQLAPSIQSEHNLLQIVYLCSFVVEQMSSDWRSLVLDPINTDKLVELQQANRLLKEQLESCRVIQSCLESEIKYVIKEKSLLNEEVKHLSYQLATTKSKSFDDSSSLPKSTEMYFHHSQQLEFSESATSSQPPCARNSFSNVSTGFTVRNGDSDSDEEYQSNQLQQIGNHSLEKNFVKKREDDFNSIMDYVRERGNVMDTLHTQLDKYQEDISELQKQIDTTNEEKEIIASKFETLTEEQKALLRERDHYESVLKLILKEKASSEFSLHDLLENLITKLNSITAENEGKSSRFSLLEGALQAVQEQNSCYREEISQMKDQIANTNDNQLGKTVLEADYMRATQHVEELTKSLQEKNCELKSVKKLQEDRYSQLHELHTIVVQSKDCLEKCLLQKDNEIKKQQEAMNTLNKTSLRQQKKIQELQKTNTKLTRETQELKHNIDQLGSIINQLRNNLNEQKSQWCDRIKCASEEVSQSKEHCRWLQSQIDHLNNQLADAHERIKAHEKDKTSLAQQVLSAEEERKVVDRKLQELKFALQGDTVLREALIERNEALQIEINRLRRAKLANLSACTNSPNRGDEYAAPPSEVSTIDDLSSLNTLPLSDNTPLGDKIFARRNRYSAAYRRGNEIPRTAVSLHTAGLSQSNSADQ